MAEESLNLSLDDIIKRNADSTKRRRGDGGAAKRGGRGGRGADRASSFQPKIQTRVVKATRGRGAGRGSSRGGNTRSSFLRDAPRDLDALEGPKPWGHNGFAEIQSSMPPRRAVQQRLGTPADKSKLEISNLDRNVTDNDIKELFSVSGQLKKWGVRYDETSGEANGTAYVQFETAAMAKDAFERYNDVALDGKPMKIAFDSGSTRKLASGITITEKVTARTGGGRIALPRVFAVAASEARIGRARPNGMRSTINRMDED
ncbi:hypothetical protein ABBQ32_011715 [Trebouxia sp. C0010 RCD-2024]